MIVADTGAMIALIDADDHHHSQLLEIHNSEQPWVLPWAVLPEIDYLLGERVGRTAQRLFLEDLASGAFPVEWGNDVDLERAAELDGIYKALRMGLVDGVVIGIAERLGANGIATLDLRHFANVQIQGSPRLLPRDW